MAGTLAHVKGVLWVVLDGLCQSGSRGLSCAEGHFKCVGVLCQARKRGIYVGTGTAKQRGVGPGVLDTAGSQGPRSRTIPGG